MTKEQAREVLEKEKAYMLAHGGDSQFTALDMAIKALEQPCEDCVSRAEVKKWLDINFCFGGAINKLNFFEKMDKELPPVTPTRKVGKWIYNNGSYKCPFCSHEVIGIEQDLKFCVLCGAEMRGSENE